MEKFGIGQPVRRKEDARFITGKGRYTDDVNLPGQAYGYVLRSPHANAIVRSIDTSAAKEAPGVLAVLTGDDSVADGLSPLPVQVDVPGKGGAKLYCPVRHVLARGAVRFVGDPIVFVVAESYEQARDAAELVEIDYDPIPAIADTAAADAPDAPLVWPEHGSNLCVHWDSGKEAETEAAFAKAAKVVGLDLVNNRVIGNPMEPRVALGDWDAANETYVLTSPTQGVIRVRNGLANLVFKVPLEKVRVISPDVGGGFGLRGKLFPESAMVCWAAKRLGRPVKWKADRQETMVCDPHGRDQVTHAEMAFDENGRILGMRARTVASVGAYLSDMGPRIPTVAGARIAGSVYDVPVLNLQVRCVFTNTVPTDAYRGAGRPEIAYTLERLLDLGAEAFGVGREEIRRRNFIKPEQLPYTNAVGMIIDSGRFAETQDMALSLADWNGFAARKAQSEREGKLRGIGVGYYIEASGGMPTEWARVVYERNGRVSVYVGTFNHGQGHETAYAQVLSEKLGVPFDAIDLRQGDTSFVKQGNGTGGSRSSQMGGVAISRAGQKVIEKAKAIAAHLLEAAAADIEFKDGTFSVAGTDLKVSIGEVAKASYDPGKLPPGMTEGLDEDELYERSTECNFPNGAHVAEVEIDPDTGVVKVVRYTAVDDCGRIINPLLVHGQIHGGVAMGLGQALLEHTAYDPESAQFIAGSFMDYAMPRAFDMPPMELGFNEVLNPSNELGVKGVGEGGACGAPPAIVSAVANALGVPHIDMPITAEKVWRVLQEKTAEQAKAA